MTIAIFDDMTQCTEAEVQRLLPLVSVQRREQALRFRHLFGRFTCLKSYEMLQQCVEEVCSNVSEESDYKQRIQQWNGLFVYNEHGKPFLQSEKSGERIEKLDFSISHCKEGIAVALAPHPIGVDIESFRQYSESLLRKTMNEQEILLIQQSAEPSVEFIKLWTKKEAMLKMQGTGIVDELPEVLCSQNTTCHIETQVNTDKGYAYSIVTPR
ncbi:MAG: 4'-phosphopantetheinyl transferase superfamily protein [Bacteroidales bacterium]|nr:4'-phosphopantetheinyl transferase superfamily protein [Bacteroidales bacterium]